MNTDRHSVIWNNTDSKCGHCDRDMIQQQQQSVNLENISVQDQFIDSVNYKLTMIRSKQGSLKTPHSSSSYKRTQKIGANTKSRNVKARQHEAIKKFNKTIHQLKKPNSKISYEHFPVSNTMRSKTPSPLREIQNTQPTNMPSLSSQFRNSRKASHQIKDEKNKVQDENFIENLFNNSRSKRKEKKKRQGHNLVEDLISKIVKTEIAYSGQKNSYKQLQNSNVIALQQRVRTLEEENEFYTKTLTEKEAQIKTLNQKLSLYEDNCQTFTLNCFETVAVFRKLESEKESINYKFYCNFLQKRMNKLIGNINFFVEKLKLQGKIRLKGHILQKELTEIFTGRQRCLTDDNRIPLQPLNLANKKDQNQKQIFSKLAQVHYRSRSSEFTNKKAEGIQILIDIISRRDSIASSRKQICQEEKKIVIKNFPGINEAHQLTLKKGDLISVLKKNQNGWWIGIKDGIVGYFPSDCLQ